MLTYLYGADKLIADFVAQMIPHCRRGFGSDARSIGVMKNGNLIAGLVYHNYDVDAGWIELSGAAIDKSWLTRETIARMYRYPFNQLGVQMLMQRTPIDDESLLRQLAAYDYTFIKIPRMFGRDRDGVLCLLTYEDWCDNRFNKRFKHQFPNPAELEDAA
jgi:hypothetical protein